MLMANPSHGWDPVREAKFLNLSRSDHFSNFFLVTFLRIDLDSNFPMFQGDGGEVEGCMYNMMPMV